MKYKFTTTLFIVCFHLLFSQENIRTNVKASDVIALFSNNKQEIKWEIPVSASESLVLQWYQRESSFTEKENIRTFVGYKSSEFKSVISIVNGLISGSVFTEKGEVQIQTSENGFLTIQKEESSHKCGLCCGAEHHQSQNLFRKLPSTRKNTANTTANRDKIILDDNVLRTFRLALPMTPGYFNGFFQNDVAKVKAFWAKTEWESMSSICVISGFVLKSLTMKSSLSVKKELLIWIKRDIEASLILLHVK